MSVITLRPGAAQAPPPGLPPEEGEHRVRVHTLDRAGYTKGAAHAGNRTVIPRARSGKGGLSEGFTPGASVVNVQPADPGTGEGGVTVDSARITPEASKRAYQLASQRATTREELILEAYRLLGSNVNSASVGRVETRPATNPIMQGYVVPQATLNGGQLTKDNPMLVPPRVGQLPPPPQPMQPMQPQLPPTSTVMPPTQEAMYQPPAAVQLDGVTRMLGDQQNQIWQMQQLMAQVSNQLATLSNASVPALISKPKPEPEPEPEEEIPDITTPVAREEKLYTREQVQQVVDKAFATLGIPRLGVQPSEPKYLVNFDIPGAGQMSARYHWVVQHGKGLFLVYDTRYEYGVTYSPPDLGDKVITVELPDHDVSYQCCSANFVQPLGKLKITNLVVVKQNAKPAVVDDEQSEVTDGSRPATMSLAQLLGEVDSD